MGKRATPTRAIAVGGAGALTYAAGGLVDPSLTQGPLTSAGLIVLEVYLALSVIEEVQDRKLDPNRDSETQHGEVEDPDRKMDT